MSNYSWHKIPGLVSGPECDNLQHLAQRVLTGAGCAVEVGAYVGRTSAAIAEGLKNSGRDTKLHVYERFSFPEGDIGIFYRQHLQVGGPEADSFKSLFLENTRPWADRIVLHAGDVLEQAPPAEPIELLHVDCSESWEVHRHLALNFYPLLTPGATIAHQDYFYHRSYYLAPLMRSLVNWIHPIGFTDTTRYFCVNVTPSRQEIEHALPSEADMPQLLDAEITRHGGYLTAEGAILATARVFMLTRQGRESEAAVIAGEIERLCPMPHVLENLHAARRAA